MNRWDLAREAWERGRGEKRNRRREVRFREKRILSLMEFCSWRVFSSNILILLALFSSNVKLHCLLKTRCVCV